MSNVLQEVLAANQRYAADFGDKAKLAMPPGATLCHPHLYGCAA